MFMIWITFFLFLCCSTSAMDYSYQADVLAQEVKLYRQFLMSEEVWITVLKYLVKNRIKHKMSLDHEIPAPCHKNNLPPPLYIASSSDNRLSITKKLLRNGADPNAVSETWVLTPLCNALEYGTTAKTVSALLRAGADPNWKSSVSGGTPLQMACLNAYRCYLRTNRMAREERGHRKSIRLLLRYGADPNVKDRDGNTPLFNLISLPQEGMNIVKQLLLFGADVTIKNNKGQDIFDYAQTEQYRPVFNTVDYLKDWQEGKIKFKKKKLR